MTRIFLATALTLAFASVGAAERIFEDKCGNTTFRVIRQSSNHPLDNRYTVVARLDETERTIHVAEDGGFFHAKCVRSKSGASYLLFQAYCGGSGCVEDKFGLVESKSLKPVVKPNPKNIGNSSAVSKLLGYNVPLLMNDKTAFCCEK
jgi:hypothetical protein